MTVDLDSLTDFGLAFTPIGAKRTDSEKHLATPGPRHLPGCIDFSRMDSRGRRYLCQRPDSRHARTLHENELASCEQGPFDEVGRLHCSNVLPNPQDRPSCLQQQPVGLAIARLNSPNLPGPPLRVSARNGVVIGAPVPEAAIDEDCQPALGEGNIHRTSAVPRYPELHPEAPTTPEKLSPQRNFRCRIISRKTGHLRRQPAAGAHALRLVSIHLGSLPHNPAATKRVPEQFRTKNGRGYDR
jgi:hypothetical protein